MIKLRTYAGFSFLATISAIYYAFSSREQFYPAMVYLSTSKICFVLLLNMGLVIMCSMWQLVKKIFLGSLREAEVERLNEQAWREVMEILFAITIFRQDFSVTFLAMVTALLLIKSLHWLAQKRVEHIETTPSVPLLSHMRIVSFMVFLLVVDCLFLYSSLKSLMQKRQASVALFFSFEYTILATTTVSTIVKYGFYVSDMLMDGQWERKAVYTFYLELVRDLVHLSLYIFFFLVIFLSYGIPLHLIRELYETFRSFRMRIADYVRYRKLTSNMDERFPDAAPEELNAGDATCIICREEMVTAKKLHCGHLFHVHCLRSWLERQHTCPTCRALVVPAENEASGSGRQHPSESSRPRSGASAEGSDNTASGENLSQYQARIRAAAVAAAVYEKSFNYPSSNPLWSSGFASKAQVHNLNMGLLCGMPKQTNEEAASSAHTLQLGLVPSQVPNSGVSFNEVTSSNRDQQVLLLKTQLSVMESKIQFLQAKLAEQLAASGDVVTSDRDIKGKAIVAPDSAASAHHEETRDV